MRINTVYTEKKRHFLSKKWDIRVILVWLACPEEPGESTVSPPWYMWLKSERKPVNIKSFFNVDLAWPQRNCSKMTYCNMEDCVFWREVLQMSSRRMIPVAKFTSSLGSLSVLVLLVRLHHHHRRKWTVLGIRSSRWQALASESTLLPATWSASPRLSSPAL